MPVHKGENCVGEEMSRWKAGDLHSGKNGPVVKSRKQALAIAISECNHSERLQSMGYSEETAEVVADMLNFADMDWKKQFDNGKGPGPEKSDNYHTGMNKHKGRGQLLISSTGVKGDLGKQKVNNDAEMLSGPALPKGPGNPQAGSSKEVFGLRMLG
jgi:hypothetical protein